MVPASAPGVVYLPVPVASGPGFPPSLLTTASVAQVISNQGLWDQIVQPVFNLLVVVSYG